MLLRAFLEVYNLHTAFTVSAILSWVFLGKKTVVLIYLRELMQFGKPLEMESLWRSMPAHFFLPIKGT